MKPCRVCRVAGTVNASRAARKDWICSRCAAQERAQDPYKRLVRNMQQYLRRNPELVPPVGGATLAYAQRVLETYGMPDEAGGDLGLCTIVFDEHSNPEVILTSEALTYAAQKRKKLRAEKNE